ncbi:SH3 domain-binding glutamic acid-rich-like protein 3 [Exaiptasia diaphana]|nr:SH3 domain-binding glutamic acid-rich-like protein 3 [Exaiptasia diaphana]
MILKKSYKGNPIKYIDIAADSEAKERMRDIAGNPKALPPQICKGNEYLGDFAAFFDAIEREDLDGFLKIDYN